MDAMVAPVTTTDDFHIEIPFTAYSQMDPRWGFEPGTERAMCGVICTKAVLDHYGNCYGQNIPSARQLLEEIIERHGWDSSRGIAHPAEVDILNRYGLVAWRRNWEAPSADPQWLIDNEGYTSDQVDELSRQQSDEAICQDVVAKQRHSILVSLQAGRPVIVSVAPGFSGNSHSHQAVLTGWRRQDGHEFVKAMDPEPQSGNLREYPDSHFFRFFNQRAIFARPGRLAC